MLGFSGFPSLPNDTWLFDGTKWKKLTPAASPPRRYDVTLTTDYLRSRLVLFGANNDLWEWDGTNWLKRAPKTMPPNRRDQDMVYDFLAQRMIMFGGGTSFPNTWEYKTNARPSINSFGTACKDSVGTPTLSTTEAPWLGETLPLRVSNLPTGGSAIMLIGFSNTLWYTIKLPADLSSLGLTGCFLLVEARFQLPMTVANGVGTFVLPIPYDTALIGVNFYCQSVNIDLTANRGKATTSNGLAGKIGAK